MGLQKGSHTIFDCKYHIIWCTKYRYRVLQGEVAERVRELARMICKANDVQIMSGHVSQDHVHMLVMIPPQLSISKVVQYLKGVTSRKLLMEFKHLHKNYWGQHLWSRGYFVVTVGNLNEQQVSEYIQNQDIHNKDDQFEISNL